MNIHAHTLRSRSGRCCLASFVLFLALLQPGAAKARPPDPEAARSAAFISAPALVGWSFNSLFSPVQSALGNGRRMIQFATIGMCLGLYILMRR